jgi:hypothetical protein
MEELINSHQQMHQNKFVTDFFIKRFPLIKPYCCIGLMYLLLKTLEFVIVFACWASLNFTLYLPCIFVQLIISHQQMHQNKCVTDFFFKLIRGNLLIKKSVTNLFWWICWCKLINCTQMHGEYNVKMEELLFWNYLLRAFKSNYFLLLRQLKGTYIIHNSIAFITPKYDNYHILASFKSRCKNSLKVAQ